MKSTTTLQSWTSITISFILTVCLVRVYEYIAVASKYFLANAYRYELAGLPYDIWVCLVYCFVFSILHLLLSLLSKKAANFSFHFVNVVLLIIYISLIIVFSERTRPFDHEFFTRKAADSWNTVKQMMSTGFKVFIPFLIYIAIYFLLYFFIFKKIHFRKWQTVVLMFLSLLAVCFIKFSIPAANNFRQTSAWYLECNKVSYWVNDSYRYFRTKNKFDAGKLNNKQLADAISFYQQNHPFDYTSTEYPLLHKNNSKDVLGSFFNLQKTPPNIVILVIEGLSRDFSGDHAYATSFTPFLDSLSNKSLVWDNFLSTAPGTFAAHPAIEGSLPYGKTGFSLMGVMPDHLSLIKILRQNGYWTNFMIGFNPDFDNMGGFIRLQGTDFILSHFGSKYKQMGVGKEGWTMGYPDDALFARSFEVLDSLHKTPYLDIYHTATTHMPYLFDQSPQYSRLFDEKMKTIKVTPDIKRTLKACKKVLITFMFSDDCIKKFFEDYAKRPEYSNTIFFITGDHHIGSFPSTGNIDDYHVPLIIYSPLLKAPHKFYSVNSHNNLAPTITALILNNYKMPYIPEEVNWLGDVLDTCTTFRNMQSMAFMQWSRTIDDYIYKDYMLSEGELYKLTPDLLMESYQNDSIKQYIEQLLENFKIINSYVCDNNKIFPKEKNLMPGERKLLFSFSDSLQNISTGKDDTAVMPVFTIPKEYHYLYANVSADVNLAMPDSGGQPAFQLSLINKRNTGKEYLYWTKRDIVLMTTNRYQPRQWNFVSTNDMFELNDYKKYDSLSFDLSLFRQGLPIHLKLKNLKVDIYGVR